MNEAFTLIQGPPGKNLFELRVQTFLQRLTLWFCSSGTGKTVVGVCLVNVFLELNRQVPRVRADEEEEKKRPVILYCGPSNKSVDVVAGEFSVLAASFL